MSVEHKNSQPPSPEPHRDSAETANIRDPKKESDVRVNQANDFQHHAVQQIKHVQKNSEAKTTEPSIDQRTIFKKTQKETLAIVSGKIERARATIANDTKAYETGTLGKRMDSVFKLGGLFGKTASGAEYEGIQKQQAALEKLENLQKNIQFAATIAELKQYRSALGLAPLSQEFMGSYDEYEAMVNKSAQERDRSLEVDWGKINADLQQAEAILDGWDTALQTIDTGVGIAAGFVPGGSEVYELSRSLTDVAIGSKTAEQAAKEFAFGIIASKVGGKALKKINVDKYVGEWVKKNAKHFTEKTAEALARIGGKAVAGAARGAIAGTTEGILHGTYDVSTGKATLEEAAANTVNRAVIGTAFGGVMGGGMEGFKMRGERKAAERFARARDAIMSIPDTPEGRADRVTVASKVLNDKPLNGVQQKAVIDAHDVPMTGKDVVGNSMYSEADLAKKAKILRDAGFDRQERRALMENGVCGTLTPPPVKKKANASTTQSTPKSRTSLAQNPSTPEKPRRPEPRKMSPVDWIAGLRADQERNQLGRQQLFGCSIKVTLSLVRHS